MSDEALTEEEARALYPDLWRLNMEELPALLEAHGYDHATAQAIGIESLCSQVGLMEVAKATRDRPPVHEWMTGGGE